MNTIYKHTSKTSGKDYVGKTTKSVNKRLNEHLLHAQNDNIKLTHFHRAILKYGVEDFETVILENNVSDKLVNTREKYWIKHYDTFNNGYNMTLGGDGSSGFKQTPEHTEKIRQANIGSKRTDEQKKNISEAHKGLPAWNKGISTDTSHLRELIICPYCDKEGAIGGMKAYHFDFCKENPNRIIREKRIMSDKDKKKRSESSKKLGKIKCTNCSKLIGIQGKVSHFKKCLK